MRALGVVLERLVERSTAVDAVEIEPRRPEVDQPVGIVAALQLAGGVECDVMVDELAEVDVAGGHALVVAARPGLLLYAGGNLSQLALVLVIVRVLSWLASQTLEHAAKASAVGPLARRVVESPLFD